MKTLRSKWLLLGLAVCLVVSGGSSRAFAYNATASDGQSGEPDQASEAASQAGEEGQLAEGEQAGDQGQADQAGEVAEEDGTTNDVDNDRVNDFQEDMQNVPPAL